LEELVAAARAQSGDARNVVLTRATAKNPPKVRNTLLKCTRPAFDAATPDRMAGSAVRE
jgi:hypothetical protein